MKYDLIVVLLVLSFTLGILLIFLSFYLPVMARNLKRVTSQFTNRINEVIIERASKSKFLFRDQSNIERQLAFSQLKRKGKSLTFQAFTRFSFLSGLIGFTIAFITTSRTSNINLPALIIGFAIGFVAPRWYLVIIDGRLQRKVSSEVPQALAKITDFARNHANLERAVLEATKELPRSTKKYFLNALEWRKAGQYHTFPEMMYDIGRKSKNPSWLDFAHMCLIDTTLGSSDKIAKLRTLQSRSRKLLLASKVERKSLNAKLLKIVLAYVFLFLIWFFETFVTPNLGVYLYTTAVGRLLMTSVYITFTLNAALFTWLYYDN